MNRNTLYLVIGALVVAVIVLGVYLYRAEQKPEGVELRLNDNGISIQKN